VLATGCDLTIEEESPRYADFRTDCELTASYVRHATALGRTFSAGTMAARLSRASTDMRNISHALPATR
jgi:hypothetical protein